MDGKLLICEKTLHQFTEKVAFIASWLKFKTQSTMVIPEKYLKQARNLLKVSHQDNTIMSVNHINFVLMFLLSTFS